MTDLNVFLPTIMGRWMALIYIGNSFLIPWYSRRIDKLRKA